MALQSSGQITFADIILEHRPNNTTVGSGLKPFKLNDYNDYSTSESLPLRFSEFYDTMSSYNTSRFDFQANDSNVPDSWAASVFDVREYKVQTNEFAIEPYVGTEASLVITLTNGGTYKCRYFFDANGSGASGSIGTSSNNIQLSSNLINSGHQNANGFFGPLATTVLGISATSGPSTTTRLYVRIIRVA